MTIDEAIKERQKVIEVQEKLYEEASTNEAKEIIKSAIDNDRQLVEWLTELKEAKKLLKSAANVLNMFIPCDEDYNCSECIKQRQNCDYDDSFRWRYADEALALIGEDGEQNERTV